MRGESVGLELTLNYKIAISQNLIFEFVTLDHWDFSHCILTYSYRTKLQALLISVGDCTACPSTEGCLRKYLANFSPKYFCQFVRPLWQADWWPPSANNPTAYSFLPQLSGIGTDGVSLSLSWRGLRARSSLQWYRTATARLVVTWPPPASFIGRTWRGTGCCVWPRVA